MKVTNFEIELSVDGKKVTATCQKFKVGKFPQIRVAFGKPLKEKVFTFYEVNEPGRRLFWYTLPLDKEKIAKSIVKTLEGNKSW